MGIEHKKVREGIVVSDRMDKTRVVTVGRVYHHHLYEKRIKVEKNFYVHDERNESHKGDRVVIVESRPLSRLKRWRLLKVVEAKEGKQQ